jgi:hypothetical protein
VPNPVQDINGDWFISIEEWEATEFHYLKEKHPDIAAGFERIETNLKEYGNI